MKALLFALGCVFLAANAAPAPGSKSEPSRRAATRDTPKPLKQGATAILLGKQITAKAGNELRDKIVGTLFKRYAEENKIRPTAAEIDAFIAAMERLDKENLKEWKHDKETIERELKSPGLSAAERKEKEEKLAMHARLIATDREMEAFKKAHPRTDRKIKRENAEGFILAWKVNQSLFQKYGGRVIYQQGGPEPLDAYRRWLEECEKKGEFRLLTDEARDKFWEYLTNDRMHTFLDKAEVRKAMTTPWWLQAADKER